MKLQDLDKTKRYDISECTDEELLCVLNWLRENDEEWCYCEISDLHNSQLEFCKTGGWYYNFIEKDSIKPTFIQENKQEQFLNELQQLCKKYDAGIYDIMDNCSIEIRLPQMNYIYLNMINEHEIDKEE